MLLALQGRARVVEVTGGGTRGRPAPANNLTSPSSHVILPWPAGQSSGSVVQSLAPLPRGLPRPLPHSILPVFDSLCNVHSLGSTLWLSLHCM